MIMFKELIITWSILIKVIDLPNIKNTIAKKTGIFLLCYRVGGVIIYEITKARFLLFVFPNLFLWYFLFYEGTKKFMHKDYLKNKKSNILILITLLIPKLAQEYVMHVAEFNIYRYLLSLI